MPIKTWAPYDRLTAQDLNDNFAAAVRHPFPGVQCGQGVATGIGANATVEVGFAAPLGWQDPLGYYQAGRLTVPAGYGGIHLLTATCTVTNGTGPRRFQVNGNSAIRQSVVGTAGIGQAINISGIWNMPAGTVTWLEVLASTDGCSATVHVVNLIRLSPAFGAPESLMIDLLREGVSEALEDMDTPTPSGDGDGTDTPTPSAGDQAADTPPSPDDPDPFDATPSEERTPKP